MRPCVLCLLAAVSAGLACPPPDDKPPEWAKVSPEQVEAAKKLGVPVAFENPVGMRFVLIPPGKFKMGSPEKEELAQPNETQHEVEITKAYYVAIHETTRGQYQRFLTGRRADVEEAEHPVQGVSLALAETFVAWLATEDKGRVYRLPTEAEWEYACRAGRGTPFWFGDTIRTDQANYDGTYTYGKGGRKGVFRGKTTPVGSFPPNGWGLYDMHGNVWEWCTDGYEYYTKSPQTDPRGRSPPGRGRVLRGGSWRDPPWGLRSAYRLPMDVDGFDFSGVRVVATVATKADASR
jgi:formylglycine-generating enzyme required for sulfatase activity